MKTNICNRKKIIFNWLRLFFLLTTAFSICIVLIFKYNSSSIDALDQYIVKKYTARYTRQYKTALTLKSQNTIESVNILISLLEQLKNIKNMDRLAELKRDCFLQLSTLLRDEGRLDEALTWTNQWVAFNDRDLTAQIHQGELLYTIPAQRHKGIAVLGKLFKKAPEVESIAVSYASMLLRQGQATNAFLAFSEHITSRGYYPAAHNTWRIYWDSGNGFTKQNIIHPLSSLEQTNRLTLQFQLKPGTQRLRIALPPFSNLTLVNPTMFVSNGTNSRIIPLTQLPLHLHQLQLTPNKLQTLNGDAPYFDWPISEVTAGKKLPILIKALVTPVIPEDMRSIALSTQAGQIEQELLNRNETSAIKFFKAIKEEDKVDKENAHQDRIASLENVPIVLYWSSKGTLFSEKQRSQAPIKIKHYKNNTFNMILPVNAVVEQLRLDFPEVTGLSFSVEEIELVYDNYLKKLNISQIPSQLQHHLQRKGNLFTIIGDDPHFSFNISSSKSLLAFVRLRGTIQ